MANFDSGRDPRLEQTAATLPPSVSALMVLGNEPVLAYHLPAALRIGIGKEEESDGARHGAVQRQTYLLQPGYSDHAFPHGSEFRIEGNEIAVSG